MKTEQEQLIEFAGDLIVEAAILRANGHADTAMDVEAAAQVALQMAARDYAPVVIDDDSVPF